MQANAQRMACLPPTPIPAHGVLRGSEAPPRCCSAVTALDIAQGFV